VGQVQLGNLPQTRKWAQVVALIEGGEGTVQLANATISAEALAIAVKNMDARRRVTLLKQRLLCRCQP